MSIVINLICIEPRRLKKESILNPTVNFSLFLKLNTYLPCFNFFSWRCQHYSPLSLVHNVVCRSVSMIENHLKHMQCHCSLLLQQIYHSSYHICFYKSEHSSFSTAVYVGYWHQYRMSCAHFSLFFFSLKPLVAMLVSVCVHMCRLYSGRESVGES